MEEDIESWETHVRTRSGLGFKARESFKDISGRYTKSLRSDSSDWQSALKNFMEGNDYNLHLSNS